MLTLNEVKVINCIDKPFNHYDFDTQVFSVVLINKKGKVLSSKMLDNYNEVLEYVNSNYEFIGKVLINLTFDKYDAWIRITELEL